MRHKDLHLLTAGRYTYTSDERFRAIHKVLAFSIIIYLKFNAYFRFYLKIIYFK